MISIVAIACAVISTPFVGLVARDAFRAIAEGVDDLEPHVRPVAWNGDGPDAAHERDRTRRAFPSDREGEF